MNMTPKFKLGLLGVAVGFGLFAYGFVYEMSIGGSSDIAGYLN
jgi:hypothetical protein